MRSCPCRLMIGVLVLALLAPVSTAWSQGTSGTLPDPITTRDLDAYGKRLDLSPEQRLAIEAFHEDYREAFRTLRDGDIAEFLESYQGLRMNFQGLDPDEIDRSVRELDRVMDRIKSVDNRLFEQIQTMLTESQIARLPRVKQARARQRYQSNLIQLVSFANPGIRVDLSESFADLTLARQEMELADPLMASYESQLTREIENLYEASTKMLTDFAKSLAEQGFDTDNPNPRQMQRMIEFFQTAWTDLTKGVNSKAMSISELNRRSSKAVAAALSPANGRRFRTSYYQAAYGEVYRGRNADARYDAAAGLEDLPQDLREQIAAAHSQFDGTRTRLMERAADKIDEQRSSFSPFQFGDSSWNDRQEELGEMRAEIREVEEQAIETLRQILGEERMAMLGNARGQAQRLDFVREGTFVTVSGPPGGGGTMVQTVRLSGDFAGGNFSFEMAEPRRADPYVPGPISDRDVETYSRRLGLSDDQRQLIDALHTDYELRYEPVNAESIEPLRDAARSQWTIQNDSREMQGPTPEKIDNLYAMRRSARDAIEQLDHTFFDEVDLVVLEDGQKESLNRVRLARERESYASERAGALGLMGGPQVMTFTSLASNQEPTVDLTKVVPEASLNAADLTTIDPVLAKYEYDYTAALKARFLLNMQIQQDMEKMTSRIVQRSGDGENENVRVMVRAGEAMQDRSEDDRNKMRQADRTLLGLNRAALSDMQALLSQRAGRELQRRYNRAAFPQVYDDPQSAERQIKPTLELDDLTPNQRTQLGEIAAAFHAEHENLCDQMAMIERDNDQSLFDLNPERRAEMEETRNELAKLRFDRTELNEKTRRKIRTILGAEQAARVQGLVTD